ncbi:CRISPR-associated ring nuclease [Paraglaciecola sp. Hal342]
MQDPMLYAICIPLVTIDCRGLTPQVVTETLYSLYIQGAPLPKHIRIITTLMGKEKILKRQLMGKNGKINQFTSEYNLEPILCSEDDVWVVTDRNGEPLNDAKDSEQHTALTVSPRRCVL